MKFCRYVGFNEKFNASRKTAVEKNYIVEWNEYFCVRNDLWVQALHLKSEQVC